MKILLTLFVLLISSSVVANSIVLYCEDIYHGGYDYENNYSMTGNFEVERFKIKLDKNNNNITSDVIYLNDPVCEKHEVEGWDVSMTCMDNFSFFAINLEDFNYYRTIGFGFVMDDKDDIPSAYGICEEF